MEEVLKKKRIKAIQESHQPVFNRPINGSSHARTRARPRTSSGRSSGSGDGAGTGGAQQQRQVRRRPSSARTTRPRALSSQGGRGINTNTIGERRTYRPGQARGSSWNSSNRGGTSTGTDTRRNGGRAVRSQGRPRQSSKGNMNMRRQRGVDGTADTNGIYGGGTGNHSTRFSVHRGSPGRSR